MSAAAPWSVKGIDPKAREVAKDLARRSGMTLGEWLNTMIMDDEDDGVTLLPRRAQAAESLERRGRSRRMDDAYYGEDSIHRLGASVEAMAARLEASERRATLAVQGIDQAVAGLVRRLDEQDANSGAALRRLDDIGDELREGHRRLRRFEQENGPETTEQFKKVETAIGSLAGRLYDIEERQRTATVELRQRMDGVETTAAAFNPIELERRLSAMIEPQASLYAQFSQRLDAAQNQTTEALRALERSFAGLDQRLTSAENHVEPEAVRETARFEKLAETLSRQVADNRSDMMRRLETVESEGRLGRAERAIAEFAGQVKACEDRGARALESMGREVLRIAETLTGRVKAVEALGTTDIERVTHEVSEAHRRELARHAEAVDHRLTRADDERALAVEKLGAEISRISDRLTDRIAQSERKSSQAIEDIERRLSETAEKSDTRYARASGELADRMRQSEERTARLIAEARETLSQRSVPEPVDPDWRTAAFPQQMFDEDWSREPASTRPQPVPEMSATVLETPADEAATPEPASLAAAPIPTTLDQADEEPTPAPSFASTMFVDEPGAEADDDEAVAEAASTPVMSPPPPSAFGVSSRPSFGGADVSDVFEAIDDHEVARSSGSGAFTQQALAAAAATGRAAPTRGAVDAARVAMEAPAEPARSAFGLKLSRGGKSKLQERLDRQAARESSTVKTAMLASVTAVVLTGAALVYAGQTGAIDFPIPGLDRSETTAPIAAVALTGVDAPTPVGDASQAPGADVYARAIEDLDSGATGAVDTLKEAATLGNPGAQFHLARLYESGGSGVTADEGEARVWTERAARGGDTRAMHNLALYMFDGRGGSRSQQDAARWFRSAAERGVADSQYNLGRLYETGAEGVPANLGEAFKWYLIAAGAGDEQAGDAAARLEARVPDAVRTTAQAAAADFQPVEDGPVADG